MLEKEKQDLTELQQAINELKTNLSSLESQEKVLGGDVAEWTAKVDKLRTGPSLALLPSPFNRARCPSGGLPSPVRQSLTDTSPLVSSFYTCRESPTRRDSRPASLVGQQGLVCPGGRTLLEGRGSQG